MERLKCWLCRKKRTCPFECYGRIYCIDCFKDHCVGCNDVHRTNDVGESKKKVYASKKGKGPLIIEIITEIVSVRADGSRTEVGDIIMKINDAVISSFTPDILKRMLNDAERHNFEVERRQAKLAAYHAQKN